MAKSTRSTMRLDAGASAALNVLAKRWHCSGNAAIKRALLIALHCMDGTDDLLLDAAMRASGFSATDTMRATAGRVFTPKVTEQVAAAGVDEPEGRRLLQQMTRVALTAMIEVFGGVDVVAASKAMRRAENVTAILKN